MLQEFPFSGVKALCENCGAHSGISTGGFFTEIWIEIILLSVIVISVFYFNVWLGIIVFILWNIVRVYIKTNGKLTSYENDL